MCDHSRTTKIMRWKTNMSLALISHILDMALKTAVWYPAKETLISGPSFPSSLQVSYEIQICSFSLNKSHVIIMGHQPEYYNNAFRYKVALIDFQRQEWIYLTNIDLDFIMLTCRGALGFEKNGKRLVIHSNVKTSTCFTKL